MEYKKGAAAFKRTWGLYYVVEDLYSCLFLHTSRRGRVCYLNLHYVLTYLNSVHEI